MSNTYAAMQFVPGHAPQEYLEMAREQCVRKLAEQLAMQMQQNEIFTVRLRKEERHRYADLASFGYGGTEIDYRLDIGQVQTLDVQIIQPMRNAFELAQWSDEFWRPAAKAVWSSIKGWFARGVY